MTLRTRSRMLCTLAVWALPLAALAAEKPKPAAPAAAPAAVPATDAAALLARAVDAFGGPAAVDAVNAIEIKSKGTRRIQADDLQVVTISRFFFPDRYYQELQMPMGVMKTVVGPKEAFLVAGEGALPLPEGERLALLKLMQRSVLALLKARKQPGFTAVAKGTSSVDGRAVSLVDVTRGGDTVTLAIDNATGQVLRSSYQNPSGGLAPAGEFAVTYSDYRKGPAGPLVYPFSAVGTMAGQPAFSQRVESIVVNPKLDEAMFQPPPPHTMFPGAEDLPLASPSPSLFGSPAPGILGLPAPSPTPSPSPK